ncbi:MAG: tetratricopeptide repeat protein, partial [Planctomycetota bacterium]
LAFELRPGVRRYAVHLGNPRARPAREAKLRRGLLLETFRFRGGSPGNLGGMRDILKRAKGHPFGADFVPNVFHGHNPFGPPGGIVSRYQGTINCSRTGTYTFATSSDDASFLLVDGELVVSWPGWHGAVGDARHKGRKSLRRGPHKFEYLHVSQSGDTIAVAAWATPSAAKIVPIPPSAFPPVSRGRFTHAERLGARIMPHFEVELAGESWFEGRWAHRVVLRDRTGDAPPGRTVRWDFGDGMSGRGGSPEHVYLRSGVFTVTMTVDSGGRKAKVANRVRVERNWRRQTQNVAEPPARYAKLVRGYDLSRLEANSLETAAILFKAVGAELEEERVLRSLVSRPAEADERVYFDAVLWLVRRWREVPRTRGEALKLLARAETRLAKKVKLRARIWRERGDVLFYYEKDLDRALGEYDKVVGRLAEKLEDHIIRITKIRIGDIFRKKGDHQKARAAYRDAERFRIHEVRGDPAVRRGMLLQTAEQQIRRREIKGALQALDVLEWEFPLVKLEGTSSLLRARAELARKNTDEALVQLDDLVRASPDSNHAAEALFQAAEIERKLGRTASAVRRYERITKEHLDSPRATDARMRLESLRPRRP